MVGDIYIPKHRDVYHASENLLSALKIFRRIYFFYVFFRIYMKFLNFHSFFSIFSARNIFLGLTVSFFFFFFRNSWEKGFYDSFQSTSSHFFCGSDLLTLLKCGKVHSSILLDLTQPREPRFLRVCVKTYNGKKRVFLSIELSGQEFVLCSRILWN